MTVAPARISRSAYRFRDKPETWLGRDVGGPSGTLGRRARIRPFLAARLAQHEAHRYESRDFLHTLSQGGVQRAPQRFIMARESPVALAVYRALLRWARAHEGIPFSLRPSHLHAIIPGVRYDSLEDATAVRALVRYTFREGKGLTVRGRRGGGSVARWLGGSVGHWVCEWTCSSGHGEVTEIHVA